MNDSQSAAELRSLIAQQRPGYSLAQPFYVSPKVFDIERAGWLRRQWFILAHGSELGSSAFIVRELLGESVIVTRDQSGTVHGFYNVCRHRGSRICDADGRGSALNCPYHSWSYRLDGSLRSAPALSAGIDTSTLALKSVAVVEVGGLILGSLNGSHEDAALFESTFGPGLRYHGIPTARLAGRRRYPTLGNWKLVIENFVECNHCMGAHPEYSSVMSHVEVLARPATEATKASFQESVDRWWATDANTDSPLSRMPNDYRVATCAATRAPIGRGRQTQSQDGRPVAPLMGGQTRFDGGVSVFRCEPFVFLAALNDHAIMFQFAPLGAEQTDVTVSWLVAAHAKEHEIDSDRLTWLWDVTTIQDKSLIERNAKGIRSDAYEPGPYTDLEALSARFVAGYLAGVSAEMA